MSDRYPKPYVKPQKFCIRFALKDHKARDKHGDHRLGNIAKIGDRARFFSESAKRIGGSNIAAPVISDIHMVHLADNIAR